jgi:hypothetical protein
MTIERRIICGLDDIKSITIECLCRPYGKPHEPPCGARLTTKPTEDKDIPERCPRCGATWEEKRDRRVETGPSVFSTLIVSIAKILNRGKDENEVKNEPKFRILLEFSEPKTDD